MLAPSEAAGQLRPGDKQAAFIERIEALLGNDW
jgi:hypothetical protein